MASTSDHDDTPLDSVSIARRKAILRGLGKTAVVAGAAVPLRSLAGAGDRYRFKKHDNKYYHCSVSGHMSVMMSRNPGSVPDCSGKPHSHYKSSDGKCETNAKGKWTNWRSDGTLAFCYKHSSNGSYCRPMDKFNAVFGSGSAKMLGELVNYTTATDESHWVAALLNSDLRATTFPHSPQQVIAHYQDSSKRAVALAFYRDWLTKA